MNTRTQLEQAIAAQEGLRGTIPDAIIDTTIDALKTQLNALEPTPPHLDQQRKQVTVLFADVSGFTAMSETMDHEEVSDVMNALWHEVDSAILKHGGYIDKHIGDAIMVLWGVKEIREEDPEQAIHAALAMQEAIHRFSKKRAVSLKMRIGLNTGPVLLGQVATTGEFTAMGDTVNVAARMESAAPIGGILITHHTYGHIRGVFNVDSREPILVKGKREPIDTYVVKNAKPRAFRQGKRGIEGLETKMIGRDQELIHLKTAYKTAIAQKQTTVVTIVGDAGVGKSRLLYEFENWIELRPQITRYFKGRASQPTQSIPLYLIRDVLATRFQIQEGESLSSVESKFVAGVSAFLPDAGEMKAHILGRWLGYGFRNSSHLHLIQDDSAQIKNRATLYLAQLFTAIGEEHPILLLLEDIHRADQSSLDAIIDLVRRCPSLPLCIVCSARPVFFEAIPNWRERHPIYEQLDLAALSALGIDDLIREILHLVNRLPEFLVDLISSRADGNPFYVEELIKMLIDDGVIITGDEVWEIKPDQLLELKIPPTLTGVIQARLDHLQSKEKQTLRQASVVGRIFWDKTLAALNAGEEPTLVPFQNKELVFKRSKSTFSGTSEYLFKHALLREVIYETVLKRAREQYHALVADWMVEATQANDRSDEYAALIGEHYHLAGALDQAAEWYGRAGKQATAQHANQEALAALTKALKLTDDSNLHAEFELLMNRVKIFDTMGDRAGQKEDIDRLIEISQKLSSHKHRAQAYYEAGKYFAFSNEKSQTFTLLENALRELKSEPNTNLYIKIHTTWAQASWQTGDYKGAHKMLDIAYPLAQKEGSASEGNVLYTISILHGITGDGDGAIRYGEQALALFQKTNDRQDIGLALNHLGIQARRSGRYSEAVNYYQAGLQIMNEIGLRSGEAVIRTNLAIIWFELGLYPNSIEGLGQSIRLGQEIDMLRVETSSTVFLAGSHLRIGEIKAAQQIANNAIEKVLKSNDPDYEAYAKLFLGQIYLALGDWTQAKSTLHECIAIRQELKQINLEIEALTCLIEVGIVQGDLEAVQEEAEKVYNRLSEDPHFSDPHEPFKVYWTLHRYLEQRQDPRAASILNQAYTLLMERADKITDLKMRNSFLNQVEWHNQIVVASTSDV